MFDFQAGCREWMADQRNRLRPRFNGAACGLLIVLGSLLLTGCIQRTLSVESTPPGALVYLNGQEIGRTPVSYDFTWYGTYDVTLRKEGFETLKTQAKVFAPWWQWIPLDFFTSMLAVTDRHHLSYELKVASTQPVDPAAILERAKQLEGELPDVPEDGN